MVLNLIMGKQKTLSKVYCKCVSIVILRQIEIIDILIYTAHPKLLPKANSLGLIQRTSSHWPNITKLINAVCFLEVFNSLSGD